MLDDLGIDRRRAVAAVRRAASSLPDEPQTSDYASEATRLPDGTTLVMTTPARKGPKSTAASPIARLRRLLNDALVEIDRLEQVS